ncbi:MAG: endonuclease/exonuclease/phosphatase family protein [Bacteroidota bacterium]|nr:endonuclease/exonuclease/phosphatase family protein [Bacteroidota bacterium]
MRKLFLLPLIGLIAITLFSCSTEKKSTTVKYATFNTSMYRAEHGFIMKDLMSGNDEQIKGIAEIIQRVRPDIINLQEFDYDVRGKYADLFRKNYLEISQNGAEPIEYKYAIAIASNTGIFTHFDLNNDGKIHTPADAYGFGKYPGQYAFTILSKYPIDTANVRTFQKFLWNDMPDANIPTYADGKPWFSDKELEKYRLSSKNHVDVPIIINGKTIHTIIAHPTPPVFDGEEDLNGKRNHDEIRMIADYISGDKKAEYLYDDNGVSGGLDKDASFVIMGDMNADPVDGDSYKNAIMQILNSPKISQEVTTGKFVPSSQGSFDNSSKNPGKGNPNHDTSIFGLRIDYVLPSNDIKVVESGVFWNSKENKNFELTNGGDITDHRMVWVVIE